MGVLGSILSTSKMSNKLNVFVSAGTPGNDAQEAFKEAVVRSIRNVGLEPRLMDERDWDYKNPLRGLRRKMSDCSGAMVIAYTRYHFPAGEELRKDGPRQLSNTTFPTAWNQIEAAMAYEKGLPLLVVAQVGLRGDAVLEGTNDIRPFRTELNPEICSSDGFNGYLNSWKDDVEAFAKTAIARSAEISSEKSERITVKRLLNEMEPVDGFVLITTIIGMILGALTIGYRIGHGQWPFG